MKKKILIVEDSEIIASDLKLALTNNNYEIAGVFANGEEAYHNIDKLSPDLVLMDIKLKGDWDGIKTTKKITAHVKVPIIYLTANTNLALFKKAVITENYGFVEKPINYTKLINAIELALYKYSQELEIQEQKNWLDLTLKSIGEGVIAIDMNWNIKFINFEALWILNKEEKNVIGKPFNSVMKEIIKNDKIEDIVNYLIKNNLTNSPLYTYGFHNHNSNVILTVECSFSLMKDDFEKIPGVVCNMKNVTLQKMRDEELLKLSNIIEIMDETVIITDKEGIIEYVNPALEDVTGWVKHEVIGKKPSLLKSGSHSNKMYKNMWDTINNKMKWSGKLVNFKKDKTHYHCDLTIIPVTDKHNEIIRFVGVGKDITTEVHSQIQLVNMHRMSALATLSGAVAHEINQPLSGIRVYTQILREEAKDNDENLINDVLELGEKIENQVTRINGIINHLKSFAKDDSTVNKEKIYIYKIIESALELIGTQIMSKSIKLKTNIPKDIYLYSDKIKVEQVIINLLTNSKNAFETCKNDSKEISIEIEQKKENMIKMIRISDNGPGIPEYFIDKIFEPFVSSKANEGVTGLGLGLAICKDIMKQLNGDIILEKTDKNGTTFILKFYET